MAEKRFLHLDPTYGYHDEHDPTADSLTIAGLSMNGSIQMATNNIEGLPLVPSGDTSAVSKAYVDGVASNITWKEPVKVLTLLDDSLSAPPGGESAGDAYIVGSTPTGDWSGFSEGDLVEWDGSAWNEILAGTGSEPADGLRVIVGASAAGSFAGQDGDLAVFSTTWGFSTPSDGDAFLVTGEDGYWENTHWSYDASGGWVQIGGAGQIAAGAGLTKDGNQLDVGAGSGISVLADSVGIDLATNNSGLTLSGDKLAVDTDGAHGIVTDDAYGVGLELDSAVDTLKVDGDGLGVVGLPALFKINNLAVGSDVTAPALDALTDGSNADSLHVHAPPSTVAAAKKVEEGHIANDTVTTGRAVRWSATNNEVTHADNSGAATARAIGVARLGAGAGFASYIAKTGVAAGVLTAATVNTKYFLGTDGALVTFGSIPVPGRIIQMGIAKNATDLDVQIMDFGFKRA